MGVADKKADAERVAHLDSITPIEINDRYVVGIDREAKYLNKTLEDHVQTLVSAIRHSQLTESLKTQVLSKIDPILFRGYSVIRIVIPPQTEVSFVGEKAFTREGSSTVEAKGPKLIAVSKRFHK